MRLPRFSFVLRALLYWGAVSALLLLVLAIAGGGVLKWRSWRYRQVDDPKAIAAKREYLEGVARAGFGSAAKPPNIVLILFDDLGFGDINVNSPGANSVGSNVAGPICTPQLDAMAAGGVRLNDYYAPAPVCSPSRAGLLTGRYPIRTRMTQVPMTPGGTIGSTTSPPR